MNEIKIDGILCNKKESFTQSGKCITTFGLNFYNGKKDGKAVYDFIDCKMFEKTPYSNKEKITITGWLGVETWTKDNRTNKKVLVYVKSIDLQSDKPVMDTATDDGMDIPF